jgi:hypothetical protein
MTRPLTTLRPLISVILTFAVILVVSLLSGCQSAPDAKGLLDRLDFEDGEAGCVRLSGDVSLGAGSADLVYKKSKPAAPGLPVPEC